MLCGTISLPCRLPRIAYSPAPFHQQVHTANPVLLHAVPSERPSSAIQRKKVRRSNPPAPAQQLWDDPSGGGYLTPGNNDGWTWDDDVGQPPEPQQLAGPAPPQQLRGLQQRRQQQPQRQQQQQQRRQPPRARQPQYQQLLGPTQSPRYRARQQQEKEQREASIPTVITRLPEHLNISVLSNGVLLLDKPKGWTACDCVNAVKIAVKQRKVGHVAPLDSVATGLMVLLLGDATRLTPDFEPLSRCYSGVIRLGVVTSNYDATGEVMEQLSWEGVTAQQISQAQQVFTGEIQQQVPMWSGTKLKGKPLSWYAARGIEIRNRATKSVIIEQLELWREGDSPDLQFKLISSKGANMRVLAHDVGKFLGCGGHLSELRRESIGKFSVEKAWMPDVFLPLAKKYARGFKFFGDGVDPPEQ